MDATFEEDRIDPNKLVVTVRRALDTGDPNDYVIPLDTEFDVAWAFNSRTSNTSSYHNKRGSFTAFIEGESDDTKAEDVQDRVRDDIRRADPADDDDDLEALKDVGFAIYDFFMEDSATARYTASAAAAAIIAIQMF